MAFDGIWWWWENPHASQKTGAVTGSQTLNLNATPRTVYAFGTVQRLRHKQSSLVWGRYYPIDFDGSCWVDSYVKNTAETLAEGAPGIWDHNVSSVTFMWNLYPGPSGSDGESDMTFTFQVIGWD